ncbi:hypothetical protein AJOOGB_AJOOGB_05230, partial [Dysosmobacter welbionis]
TPHSFPESPPASPAPSPSSRRPAGTGPGRHTAPGPLRLSGHPAGRAGPSCPLPGGP